MKLDAEILLHGMNEANAQIHAADMRSYCIVNVGGDKKPIAVRGELGAERVIDHTA